MMCLSDAAHRQFGESPSGSSHMHEPDYEHRPRRTQVRAAIQWGVYAGPESNEASFL